MKFIAQLMFYLISGIVFGNGLDDFSLLALSPTGKLIAFGPRDVGPITEQGVVVGVHVDRMFRHGSKPDEVIGVVCDLRTSKQPLCLRCSEGGGGQSTYSGRIIQFGPEKWTLDKASEAVINDGFRELYKKAHKSFDCGSFVAYKCEGKCSPVLPEKLLYATCGD